MTTMTAQTSQVYSVYIRATADQIWEAITRPEFTQHFFHGVHVSVAPDAYRAVDDDGTTELVAGRVIEFEPPRRLVHSWRSLYRPELAEEEDSRVSWEIEPQDNGVCLLTVVHDRLEGAPKTAVSVSGTGWMHVLSGLKTLLETRQPLFD